MHLKMVTFTGADDRTSVKDLERLSSETSWVEWGILSNRRAIEEGGSSLFPSMEWVDRFLDTNTDRCLHLCGNLCRKLIAGDDTFIKLFSAERLRQFTRVQLNFHDNDQQGLNVELFLALVDRYQLAGLKWIVPVGDENIPAVQQMKRMGLDVVVLFDDSRGAGVSPEGWRAPLTDVSCGYSGGLGPHNLATELPRIRSVVPSNYPTWVDMERRVRSGDDDTFDLSKVQASIDQAKRFKEIR